MKCRVYKNGDDVIYNWPAPMYQTDETFDTCKVPSDLQGLPMAVIHKDDLPQGDYLHEQLYFDGDPSKDTLKVDIDWTKKLMPAWVIKQKHQDRLLRKLDAELAKDDPDPVALIKLQREKDQVKDWDDARMYQQALANIEEDNKDKPGIVNKLNAKIQEANK